MRVPYKGSIGAAIMSATSYLVRPTPVFRESYLEALREGYRRGAQQAMEEARIAAIAADFEAHLDRLDQDGQSPHVENGRTVPTVPSNAFWLVDGANFAGSVHIFARVPVRPAWPIMAAM
jgi:hypothetical protein